MLVTLLLCIYISWLCWTWGNATLLLMQLIVRSKIDISIGFPIKCLTGLVVVTAAAGYTSIFLPLSNYTTHIILLILTSLLWINKSTRSLFKKDTNAFKGLPLYLKLFPFVAIILTISLSTWEVYHPDTLGYHAQIIQWIKKYKAVPGIIHLNSRFGLQSSWFVSCALFNFEFAGVKGISFINSAIIIWMILLLTTEFSKLIKAGRLVLLFILISFTAFSFWSFTQIRLTAMSASPDFIAALFCWTIFFLFIRKWDAQEHERPTISLLLILLISFSFTIKLSSAPLLFLALFLTIKWIQQKNFSSITTAVLLGVLIVTPFLTRNIITSGYAFYPSASVDLFNVDWKVDKAQVEAQMHYINAYARDTEVKTAEEVRQVNDEFFLEWSSSWWDRKVLSDKIIIVLSLLSLLACIIQLKRIRRSNVPVKVSLAIAVFGLIAWFISAPDTRFAWSFLMFVPFIVLNVLFNTNKTTSKSWLMPVMITGISIVLAAYACYRFINYFRPSQWISPIGIKQIQSEKFNCGNQPFNRPVKDSLCADIPIPCTLDSCKNFQLRSNRLKDGFRAK